MCGIVGFCGPSTRFGDRQLQEMLCAIKHRGPDDSGVFSAPVAGMPDSQVWLGSRRLAIQDLSPAGHQPMTDPATGNTIAFNGEIYNFLELRSELERAGSVFRSRCDTEVALQSWCTEGLPGVDRWRGMFAVALWDQSQQELWLVRDQWGIKPLYYWRDGEALVFGSEVRSLLASGLVPRRLSRRGTEDYLQYGALQDPVTIIDGVYALLPGHALRWSRGRVEVTPYSKMLPSSEAASESGSETLDSMLRKIVCQQLISDVPVVVFLSGGVDSSIVSLLARQEAGSSVNTMSLVFEEDRYSEQHYARQVAQHIGTQHHEVLLRGEEAQSKAVEAVSRMDQPSVDGINSYVICGAARRAGFTVALSGLGGDEFFGGYPTFRRTAWLKKVDQWASRAPSLAGLIGKVIQPGVAGLAGPARKLSQYLQHGNFGDHPYFLQRTIFFPSQVQALCHDGVRSSEADEMADARLRTLLESATRLDPLNQVSFLEARTYMCNVLLRDSDQMSMLQSLELRVPLVDQLLGAYLLAIPGKKKGFGRASKLWLREAFARFLPPAVFTRKKMGFTLPFAVWLKGPLRQDLERTLQRNIGEIWDPTAAWAVWQQFCHGRLDWSRPWALYVLSRWVAEHIHGETSPL